MATAAPESHLRENPFRIAQQQLENVALTFGIDDRLVAVLSQCKKAVEVSIPTTLDNGSIRAFEGYRAALQREEHVARVYCQRAKRVRAERSADLR